MDEKEFELEKLRLVSERHKTWLGFAKFILGGLVLGIFSTLINSRIQEKEIELKREESAQALALVRQQEETRFVSTFVEQAIDKDLEKRRDLAEYFAFVSPTEAARGGWQDYLDAAEQRITASNELQTRIAQIRFQTEEAAVARERAKAAAEIEAIRAETSKRLIANAESRGELVDQLITDRERSEKALEDALASLDERDRELRRLAAESEASARELASLRPPSVVEDEPPVDRILGLLDRVPIGSSRRVEKIVDLAGKENAAELTDPIPAGYYMFKGDDEFFARGAIVRPSDPPLWRTVHGYAYYDGSWAVTEHNLVYLGPTWDDDIARISEAFRGGINAPTGDDWTFVHGSKTQPPAATAQAGSSE